MATESKIDFVLNHWLTKILARHMSKEDQSLGQWNQIVEDLERKRSLLKTINDFAIELLRIPTRTGLVWYVAREVVGRLGFDDCVIYLMDSEQHTLRQVAAIGVKNPQGHQIVNALEISIGEGITGQVAQSKLPVIVDDLSADDRYIPDVEPALSEICVPLIIGDEVVGVIDCEDPRPRHFGQEHLETLTTIAAITSAKLKILDEVRRVNERAEELSRLNEQHRQEIVGRKKVEERLRQSEAQLDEALEAMSEAFIYFDAEDRVIRANSKHRELFPSHAAYMTPGTRFEDLLRMQVKNVRLPWAVGREEEWIAERVAQHRNPGDPVEQKFADGRIIRLSENTTKSGGTVSIRADITELKRVEEALRDSEERLSETARLAQIGYMVWDIFEERCVTCSETYAQIHGLTVEEFAARTTEGDGYFAFSHPGDQERIRAAAKEVRKGETLEMEYRLVNPDGAIRNVRSIKRPIFDEAGNPIQEHEVLQDVTQIRQVEEALRQSQKLEAVGQLTGGVAHDFNNLLAIMMGNAEVLEGKLKDDDCRTLLGPMIRASQRGAELTSRLLAFSRQQPLNPRAVNIGELCMGMTELLHRTLGETIEIDLRREDPSPALADPGQLENAMLNLALNARDAMPGGGKLTIEIGDVTLTKTDMEQHTAGQPGDYVVLKVTDSGMGIAPDVIGHVFEPFFTTKEVGAGSGLGLSMIYGFARQSGGHVTIESEQGQGTMVALYLPQAEAPVEEAQREAVDDAVPMGQGETILVVEDEPALRHLAVTQLETLGYKTLQAPNGPVALEVLADSPGIDLLLSDVVLPRGMSGPEIYRQVKERHPDLKCLFMSGYPVTPERTLPGCNDLIRKPFKIAELAKRLRSALHA